MSLYPASSSCASLGPNGTYLTWSVLGERVPVLRQNTTKVGFYHAGALQCYDLWKLRGAPWLALVLVLAGVGLATVALCSRMTDSSRSWLRLCLKFASSVARPAMICRRRELGSVDCRWACGRRSAAVVIYPFPGQHFSAFKVTFTEHWRIFF